MVDYKNVRVPVAIANALQQQAKELGVSMSALVQQVLEREVQYGPDYAHRPVHVPPGFSAQAEQLAAGVGGDWLVVYRARIPVIVAGKVERLEPMFLHMQLYGGERLRMTIPRAVLLGWSELTNIGDGAITQAVLPLQLWGACLHPNVVIGGRAVNGIHTPPAGALQPTQG